MDHTRSKTGRGVIERRQLRQSLQRKAGGGADLLPEKYLRIFFVDFELIFLFRGLTINQSSLTSL